MSLAAMWANYVQVVRMSGEIRTYFPFLVQYKFLGKLVFYVNNIEYIILGSIENGPYGELIVQKVNLIIIFFFFYKLRLSDGWKKWNPAIYVQFRVFRSANGSRKHVSP